MCCKICLCLCTTAVVTPSWSARWWWVGGGDTKMGSQCWMGALVGAQVIKDQRLGPGYGSEMRNRDQGREAGKVE